jgi:carbohydrate-selective porin OprB
MKNSNQNWKWITASAACALIAINAAPARAQDANTGLLGNIGGLRTTLGNYGITLGLNDSENLLANLSRR